MTHAELKAVGCGHDIVMATHGESIYRVYVFWHVYLNFVLSLHQKLPLQFASHGPLIGFVFQAIHHDISCSFHLPDTILDISLCNISATVTIRLKRKKERFGIQNLSNIMDK